MLLPDKVMTFVPRSEATDGLCAHRRQNRVFDLAKLEG